MLKLNLRILSNENIKGNVINHIKSLRAFIAVEVNILSDVQASNEQRR